MLSESHSTFFSQMHQQSEVNFERNRITEIGEELIRNLPWMTNDNEAKML